MTMRARTASAEELEAAYQRELSTDRWAAAESCYALAVLHRDSGDWATARDWVRQCRRLLDGFSSDHLEQVATRRVSVGGVPLPGCLHDGVLRERFGAFD
ncbi:hypothetical protein [Streptomyces otsuchiensis]|uniref:hypothetical protein n=1 Tax=Streptomyces otsuchiensis TaxID=2681388 RepID=UPI0010323307|nr:hypothetical protein [Streptomyces otsuchiensis]